jgi:hypothetical protein
VLVLSSVLLITFPVTDDKASPFTDVLLAAIHEKVLGIFEVKLNPTDELSQIDTVDALVIVGVG